MSLSSVGASAELELVDVEVAFGSKVAVDGVSIQVAAGSTLAVLGPSGSGKSTLLRTIAGLESPLSGRVLIDGKDQREVTADKRNLGMMFQDHALFPHLDVAANVAFGLNMRGVKHRAADERVAEVLDLVDLGGFGGRDVSTLSGGEAQRVALARALAPSPRLLLLDEPLGSLDRVLREELVDQLRGLFARLEVTVVHVTHDQQEAFALAHDVVVMRDGAVVQQGAAADLWHSPRDVFVAEFLGHPNLWPAADGVVLAPVPSLRVVDRSLASTGDQANLASGVVADAAFRDGRWRLTVLEEDGAQRRIVVESSGAHRVGERVLVSVDPDQLHTISQR